jgi:prepilin-type N-terminal cleavage/methylation domain-containing protein/prepilin-type processing-associated H-X9-DG protein
MFSRRSRIVPQGEVVLPCVSRRAFTLIELLVVISIISLLVALLLPVLASARNRAIDLKCEANIRGADYMFQLYFNDYKNFIPPLCGKELDASPPAYSYSNWYSSLAPYAGIDSPTNVTADKASGLCCPADNGGSASFPHYSYAMLYSNRFRNGLSAPQKYFVSNRVDDFAQPSESGLLVDNGKYASAIYYMTINWSLFGNPSYASRATHDGRGTGVAFMDGHATFVSVHPQDVASTANGGTPDKPYGDYGPKDVPWNHRAFWGRYRDGSYAPFSTNYYKYQP